MTWPTSTKASTNNVDQGSDTIKLARPDIKQNIENVNAIIDTFDIGSPNNNDVLKYNSTSGKFEPANGNGIGHTIVITFDTGLTVAGSSYPSTTAQYGGGFTIVGSNFTNITITQESTGQTNINFPAGTYTIQTLDDLFTGNYGSGAYTTMDTYWMKESDNSVAWRGYTYVTSFYFRKYCIGEVVTFGSDTVINMEYKLQRDASGSLDHKPIIINRLA